MISNVTKHTHSETVTFNEMHNIFLDGMMYLDQLLVNRKSDSSFLISERVTLADIVIFNEINMFLHLNEYQMDSEDLKQMPTLSRWIYIIMPTVDGVDEFNNKMQEEMQGIQ
jgi:glutathionyl-hydroquinone reductase